MSSYSLCSGADPSFLNSENCFELEGEISALPLPTSLQSSIRLRLATVEEQEPALYLLLQLAVVLSGSFVTAHVEAVWSLLQPEGVQVGAAEVEKLLMRALELKLLKQLSASGVTGQRRRSTAANTRVHFVFHQ